MDRFGRVDTLVNNAGVFVSKPLTDYTAEDYALVTGASLSHCRKLSTLAAAFP